MSAAFTHRNPWIAKVHAWLLTQNGPRTVRQIVAEHGRPPGKSTAAWLLRRAEATGWLDVDQSAGARLFAYTAVVVTARPWLRFASPAPASQSDRILCRSAA